MVKVKQKMNCFLLIIVCLLGIFTLAPNQAQAASKFQIINVTETSKKVGNITFFSKQLEEGGWRKVYYKKGNVKRRLSTDEKISTVIMTDGKTAYYSVVEDEGESYCETVFEKKLSTGHTRKIFSIHNVDGFDFVGYDSGKIYYIKNLDPGTLCSYNLKTKKHTSLLNNVSCAEQYGRVLLCIPYEGAGGPLELQLFNIKTNKAKLLAETMLRYTVTQKQIYYVECIKEYNFNDYLCNVVRCDMNGNSRKVLLKNQRIKGTVDKITSSYITYQNYDTNKTYKIKY